MWNVQRFNIRETGCCEETSDRGLFVCLFFRIAPDGHWQARPFTDRFGSSEADVLYQFPLVQGGTNVLLPTRCVDELYVNTAYTRGVSRVRELVP